MSDQRHPSPYADHPAALILADHERSSPTRWASPSAVTHVSCACDWRGPVCDHPAHLVEVLVQAGLLAPDLPPGAVRAWLTPADVEARLHAPAMADDPDRLRARRDELEAALTDATPPPGPDPRRVTLSPHLADMLDQAGLTAGAFNPLTYVSEGPESQPPPFEDEDT